MFYASFFKVNHAVVQGIVAIGCVLHVGP